MLAQTSLYFPSQALHGHMQYLWAPKKPQLRSEDFPDVVAVEASLLSIVSTTQWDAMPARSSLRRQKQTAVVAQKVPRRTGQGRWRRRGAPGWARIESGTSYWHGPAGDRPGVKEGEKAPSFAVALHFEGTWYRPCLQCWNRSKECV